MKNYIIIIIIIIIVVIIIYQLCDLMRLTFRSFVAPCQSRVLTLHCVVVLRANTRNVHCMHLLVPRRLI